MNRRDFLLSATGFALAPSAVVAAEPTGPASDDTVLEDFESGNFTGWTFTGNCWAKTPTTATRYRDRITNYQGRYYLLSSSAGTGTATSPEYIVSKPYLKFKIAGGSSRGTRIELIADGKLDRWASGNDSLDFEDCCIDISHLMGKNLTIKVIDTIADNGLGTTLVDDFRLSARPIRRYINVPSDIGVEARFIKQCRFFQNQDQWSNGRALNVGLSPQQFDVAINEVYKRMLHPDVNHVPGRSVKALSALIYSGVAQVIAHLRIGDRPALLKKWLLAEGVCAWVATHVVYDGALANLPQNDAIADRERVRRFQSETILNMNSPSAVCSGQSRLTTDLATELDVRCLHLDGEATWYGDRKTGQSNHGWLYFDFGDGIATVADVSQGAMSLADMRRINGKMNCDYLLPRKPIESELFLAKHYATGYAVKKSDGWDAYMATLDYSLTDMPYTEWVPIDTTYLKDAWKKYRELEYKKIKLLNAVVDIQTCKN